MMVAIHQPQYLPWLGYIEKIDRSDKFVFLDNVQFKKNEWQNRNRIKSPAGWQWITVPVLHKFPQKILEVRINNKVNWRKKNFMALVTNYSRTPYFKDYEDVFKEIYERDWEFLVDINIHVVKEIASLLGIDLTIMRASEFNISEDKTQRLVDICKLLGADTYYSGRDGAKYMEVEKFEKEGIKVATQDFHHPVYRQLWDKGGEAFESNMSVVDLLFNHGPESLAIIRGGR